MTRILAVDPGPEQSAWLMRDDEMIAGFGIFANADLLEAIHFASPDDLGAFVDYPHPPDAVVIEQIRSFGMAVGAEVFDTVHWSGRFHEAAIAAGMTVELLPRIKVKIAICHDSKAKDANIRQALIDRFGGPASIRKGGALYGISKDVWSALAIAVTAYEARG